MNFYCRCLALFGIALIFIGGVAFIDQVMAGSHKPPGTYIDLLAPNGGECLETGTAFTISTDYDSNHIAIYYRTDGQQPTHLDSSIIKHPLNATTWSWTPSSDDISETGRIWIQGHLSGHDSDNLWDDSDADFAIRASCAVATQALGIRTETPPPIIQGNVTIQNILSNSADILWTTDRGAYTFVEYGTTIDEYTASTTLDATLLLTHSVTLDTLLASTTYFARAVWGQALDKKFTSDEFSFSTLSLPDITPPAKVRNIFSVAGSTTALLWWKNPLDPDFSEVIIMRRDDRFPEHRKDGETVFRSDAVYYRDAGLENSTTYYYSIFSLDATKNSSLPITVALTPLGDLPLAPLPPSEKVSTTTDFRLRSLSSESTKNTIILSWQNPENEHFLGVQIVRNTEALPANAFDGEVVFRGRSESFTDSNLVSDTRYFYGLFAFDWDFAFSPAVFIADITLVEIPDTTTVTLPGEGDISTEVGGAGPVSSEEQKALQLLQLQITEIQRKVALLLEQFKVLLMKLSLPLLEQLQEKKQLIYTVTTEKDGFNPRSITISIGDIVRFINNTNGTMWPASDVHASHTVYPEKGGCVGSFFDACKELVTGEEYSFEFNIRGTWSYHDHINPDKIGTIIVQ